MTMRRFARPTRGFRKNLENFKALVSWRCARYTFVRPHRRRRIALPLGRGTGSGRFELVEQTGR
jgi:hypothetical protein